MKLQAQQARGSAGRAQRRLSPEPDYLALAELRHQIRRFLTFSERAARAAGVEPRQHQLLLAVKGLAAGCRPTIGVLAERLQLEHHTVVGLVDRLVDAGLVRRHRGAEDRREILLRITRRGERLLQVLSLAHRAELEAAGPALVHALQAIVSMGRRGRVSRSRP
jgi:DNA-binding MarR family transcriptional regulator